MQINNDISHAIRLTPGEDLRLGIQQYLNQQEIKAGWIVTCVGSLAKYNIRFANKLSGEHGSGYFEIISLSGTLSENGCHIHICIADDTGKTIGGHLLDGCIIYTTAEIIISESGRYIFTRESDGNTSWKELKINHEKLPGQSQL